MTTKRKKAKAKRPSKALARRPAATQLAGLGPIERLARDPKLTVDKLERLIAAKERLDAKVAEAAYWRAFDEMKPHLPIIRKNGIIRGKAETKGTKGPIQSRYAKFEDIQAAIAPILPRFGFVYSYKTEWPQPTILCIVCRLKHRDGHFEESRFQSPADNTGGKNAIQGLASANSYGKRYTIKDLLDLQEQGVDDDGNLAGVLEKKTEIIDAETIPPGGTSKPAPQQPPRDAHHTASKEPITEGQLRRLYTIAKNSGRLDADIKAWLRESYGLDNSRKIRRCDYDAIVSAIESPALHLPIVRREPGQEG